MKFLIFLSMLTLAYLFLLAAENCFAQNLTKPNIVGHAGIKVNSFTGNKFYQRSDLFIPGRGLSLNITFTYNGGEGDSAVNLKFYSNSSLPLSLVEVCNRSYCNVQTSSSLTSKGVCL